MTTEANLAGAEKLQELGFDAATLADAEAVFDVMLEAKRSAGEIALPRMDNCISYAARDNEGHWYELRANQWVRYEGPGRKAKPDEAK